METSQVLDAPLVEKPAMEYATKGERFSNYIVDAILCYVFVFMIRFALSALAPELIYMRGFITLMTVVVFTIYYTVFEHSFGKTPGKFITRTHVVTEDGERPTLSNILGRSLCRIIPFDGLSFLFSFTGWHDTISKTCVVKDDPKI